METQTFLEGEAEARVVSRARPTEVSMGREKPKAWAKSRNAHYVNMTRKIM